MLKLVLQEELLII